MKLKTFIVSGSGDFPYDMLRYDACWPATEQDSVKLSIHPPFAGTRSVRLETWARNEQTAARWASFGWQIERS